MAAPTKRKSLTPKQVKFVKARSEGMTGVKAAMMAYDTTDYSTAATIANENMNKPELRALIEEGLFKHGLSIDSLMAPIGEALKDDSLDMRLKGSDRGLRIYKDFVAPQDKPGGGNTINFNFGDKK